MPDLATHAAFAYLFSFKTRRFVCFLFLGAILPDVLRLPFILFKDPHAFWVFNVFHTPFGIILAALLIAFLFDEKICKRAFWWMMLGIATHLILDLFQMHYMGVIYAWFFPFSFQSFEIGLFWPETPLYFAPFMIILAIIFYFFKKKYSIENHGKQNHI